MEDIKLEERPLMSEEEFREYLNLLKSTTVSTPSLSKYKSIARAIRRGKLMENGMEIPKRPFNNRTTSSKRKQSREFNELKKSIYKEYVQGGKTK